MVTSFKAQATKMDYNKPVTKVHEVLCLSLYWFLIVNEFDEITLKTVIKEEIKPNEKPG